jgi:phosphonopyruvate decarboxylase
MIDTVEFYNYLVEKKLDSFYGVPDSLLKELCACITSKSSVDKHIITANEGNAIAIAAGKYLATGNPAVVYMQNSGLGNTVNPLLSLVDEEVYRIPMLLLIGWRGEPGVHDEPQHVKQGKVTLELLNTMGIRTLILEDDYKQQIDEAYDYMLKESRVVALIVRKNMFSKFKLESKVTPYQLTREEALKELLSLIDNDSVIVSTTGKTSREVFEIRERLGDSHDRDFLTVGSMGHTSSIALGISLSTSKKVYCIDGDGALIMHLGGLGIVTQNAKPNLKYIVINNGAHESVGGQPTIAFNINLKDVLLSLGFKKVFVAENKEDIKNQFESFNNSNLSALIINTKQGSRDDLGRPTSTPEENKKQLMKFMIGK